ncbi:hypothetical protein RBH29_12655 [Herbivorax sp. ANBcel31]|uniref:hypothetical protein n=1 Tax=Herbivorax sp. ANBcel31 TaxID=3069754 RepID=UPI0027AF1619|nr:hypothetical protein [Herbivorax sp. ANBcel31]MDQ2087275.1 hypothetical protein [Herbivorax sp. ANBcel31]
MLKFLRRNHFMIMIFISIILVITSSVLHVERKKIESNVSSITNHDVKELVYIILDGYNITEEVLNTGVLTTGQAWRLYDMYIIFYNYSLYPIEVSNNIGGYSTKWINIFNTTHDINVLFSHLLNQYDKNEENSDDEVLVKLDNDLTRKIRRINDLHLRWISAINLNHLGSIILEDEINTEFEYYENLYGDFGIENKEWFEVMDLISLETDNFLDSLGSILQHILGIEIFQN